MKKELKNKLHGIGDWIKKERYFLILLAIMTVSMFVAMYTKYALIVCFAVTVVCAAFLDFENSLGLFMFCHSFQVIFAEKVLWNSCSFMYLIFLTFFGVCAVKYFINVLKKECKFNWKVLIPMLVFLVYIVLPINTIKIKSTINYLITFIAIYLLLEFHEKINYNNVIIYAILGAMVSMLFSYVAINIPRMREFMQICYNYGVRKVQRMFINPNTLACTATILIAVALYKFIFLDWLWSFALLGLLIYSYGTLSRNFLICLGMTFGLILIFTLIRRKKKHFIKFGVSIVLLLAVCLTQLNATKVYIMRFGEMFGKEYSFTIEQDKQKDEQKWNSETGGGSSSGETSGGTSSETNENETNNSNSGLWIDGTPLDPGREGIWKRYLKEITSSPQKLIFGSGISAEKLGAGTHNAYIDIIWRFGLFGSFLLCIVFFVVAKLLIRNWNFLIFMELTIFLLTNMFENIIFGELAVYMIIVLMASADIGKIEKNKEKTNEQNISDSTDL